MYTVVRYFWRYFDLRSAPRSDLPAPHMPSAERRAWSGHPRGGERATRDPRDTFEPREPRFTRSRFRAYFRYGYITGAAYP